MKKINVIAVCIVVAVLGVAAIALAKPSGGGQAKPGLLLIGVSELQTDGEYHDVGSYFSAIVPDAREELKCPGDQVWVVQKRIFNGGDLHGDRQNQDVMLVVEKRQPLVGWPGTRPRLQSPGVMKGHGR